MSTKKQQQHIVSGLRSTIIVLLFFILLAQVHNTYADNLTSTSYQIEYPTLMLEGGQAESASFKYISNTGELATGQSASTNFTGKLGFLYFPTASTPVISATAGSGQVSLSWTASTGVEANVTNYKVGVSTSSGGTYTYTSVGAVLSYVNTGLSNGTTYYFKVQSYASGILLATSTAVSATPVAASTPPASGGGGGGGGPPPSSGSQTGVNFSGRAYPLSKVTILKDGQIVLTTIAGPDSNFSASLNDLSTGSYNFSVYGQDKNGIRSNPFTFPIYITSGTTTNIGGIFISPTIAVDKEQVKKGENIVVFGQSAQLAEITININSDPEYFIKRNSDANGVYLLNFDTSVLDLGKHTARSKAAKDAEISPFGASVGFAVGNKNVEKDLSKCDMKADLNGDCKINLVDFSIAAFWYKKPLSANFKAIEASKLNNDGKIDLIDFSILAYHWTG